MMSNFLGIDTSNYTTSSAIVNPSEKKVIQLKKLLPVGKGQLGLRQSDAVFHHTKQLPCLLSELFEKERDFEAVGVSVKPRDAENSYMPCFLCGEGYAETVSALKNVRLFKTTHQTGHILAALLSTNKIDFVNRPFIAFHISGGTTDCLLCTPDSRNIINIKQISGSLDLKAGQAIDRTGLMLGLDFPCGMELEKLASQSDADYKIKPFIKDGWCSLSGIENKCRKMLDDGCPKQDIAKYCIESIYAAVYAMTSYALETCGEMPVVYAGGVMSNSYIKNKMLKACDAYFAEPEFSCDNAVGTAVYAWLKSIGGYEN